MVNTSLEITENEYLIKLNRSTFDLSFIRNLLKIVEVSKPADDYAADDKNLESEFLTNGTDYYSRLDEK
jgi:hypothetical protein